MRKPNKYKTTSEAAIRALVAEGLKFPEIAERLGVNLSSLRTACYVLGIKSPCNYGSIERAREFLGLLEVGCTLQEIGDKYGISKQAVAQQLAINGLPTTTRAAIKAKLEVAP